MTIKRKIVSAIATGALLVNAFTPLAFADTTIEISGNGYDSTNKAYVDVNSSTTVVQSNTSNITNTVDSNATTGGNEAEKNTGGNVTIETGDATSKVDVSTKTNANQADVNNCNCEDQTNVVISGNGADSYNKADLDLSADTNVFQNNDAKVNNNIDSDAKTGNNEAGKNTGGDVTIKTGDATSDVKVTNKANANVASVGGGSSNGGSSVDARIVGNGYDSTNKIYLDINRPVVIIQDNYANIYNDVDANAKTGKNEAEKNTGGNVTIETGDAKSKVIVDNMVNFNAADVDCDCLLGDVNAKVSGNGTDSYNKIKADLGGDVSVFQGGEKGDGNNAYLNNDVDANAKTGKNEAEKNTGPVVGDPTEVMTGDAYTETKVSNSANANVFGPLEDVHLPEGVSFDFNFNLGDLFGSIHLG